ncbi:FAD-binding and (Fe-S)-binding domain-containing protein [Desulfuribacillus alkaliarsenatis]|uniref:D-lactate dehydrogenase (cytochrome) n=1 Tax=Desulfuribacillus alkaliarsenatis TaxID=766136 RepID=A0A1E5G1C9_9FIRM|nr:FAD-binding and (Fe-S)-binding domain-containing protein [Desulfuribacillus alkaliarsenatis]OEF96630.1 4Fe-4S ferredoxin [Desulfuribacillus alkaliarsenatis]
MKKLQLRIEDIKALPSVYQQFYNEISHDIPDDRIIADPLRRIAYGTDGSFYRLIPKLVIKAKTCKEITKLMEVAAKLKVPVTFRAAGTSLSGQAISDSILIYLYGNWSNCAVQEDGDIIKLEPGVIGAEANRKLIKYSKKIGPDPASINHAMIGGIAANNASGMCCGIADNSYKTVVHMKIIFWDGTILDTSSQESIQAFQSKHADLIKEIERIRDEILADIALKEQITHKFKIKNTTGYSINAFVDFYDPIDIIKHLMIGSEGTLGFIAEISYRTVREFEHRASALVVFPDIEQACKGVMRLERDFVSAAELMDRSSLRSVENVEGMPPYLKDLNPKASALLIEVTGDSHQELQQRIDQVKQALSEIKTELPIEFTDKKPEYQKLWNIRKGLFPAVGAMRKIGTTVIIEDVAFPMENLAESILALQDLFEKHGYHEAIIFGHALDSNVHFVFTQDFGIDAEVERYDLFMQEVCDLVADKYGGSLKAEHGTGRNMAPFVEKEWGKKAYEMMVRIKSAFDPLAIINPGVIINDNPNAHLEHLKPLPAVHEIIDKCIECGFCEVNCPSQNLTTTPRQRITTRRMIARLKSREGKLSDSDKQMLERLQADYTYMGNQTCAVDGLCSTTCPVGINTGSHTKVLRSYTVGRLGNRTSKLTANNFKKTTSMIGVGLATVNRIHSLVGTTTMGGITRATRRVSGDRIPLWSPWMPQKAKSIDSSIQKLDIKQSSKKVVYYPSCISRTMGPAKGDIDQRSIPEVTLSVLNKAGFEVIIPEDRDNLCCGVPYESKGFFEEADAKSSELEKHLLKYSNNGEIPVLCDTSPCTFRMQRVMGDNLKIYEPVEFIHDHLLEHLDIEPVDETIAVHVTCSSIKMNLGPKFSAIAKACAKEAIFPEKVRCCGFSGDKGFTTPELNASALATLKDSLEGRCTSGYSNSRTCEIGLSHHGEISYQSILYLIDRCAKAK